MNLLMCSPEIGVTLSGRTLNNLRYEDDIVLIATTPTALQQLTDKVDAVSRDYGLEFSTWKTKVMLTSEGRDQTFTYNGEALEQEESFRYLGAVVTSTGDCVVEIRSTLGITRLALTSVNNLWKYWPLNKDTK